MKRKNKLIFGFLIAAVLLGGLIFYKPAQEEFNFRRIDEEPELLESKTLDVDGTSVRFDLYDDKGVKVQVAVPLSDEDGYKLDMEALAKAAEGLFETEETLKRQTMRIRGEALIRTARHGTADGGKSKMP